jgi:ankyrin repeat protein
MVPSTSAGDDSAWHDAVHALLDAVIEGDVAAVDDLLRARPLLAVTGNCADGAGGANQPLFLAAGAGHSEIVRLLVAHGADPAGAPTDHGWTPLAIAAAYGHDDIVAYLLDCGVAPDVFVASALGDLPRVIALVSADPKDLARRGPDGARPLHFAGTVAVAEWLVAHGADPLARDDVHENTPARWAAADTRRPDVARYLAQFDAETDIFLACAVGDADRVRQLLSQSPALADAGGRPRDLLGSGTPLHVAAERGHADIVELLLGHGADPNQRSAYGHFALHCAAMRGRRGVIELLLAYGARPDVRDRGHNATPATWAARFGYDDLADLLEHEAGGDGVAASG